MKPKTFMLIAGETSGDLLAAELVRALRRELAAAEPVFTADYQPLHTSLEPRFVGAGGQHMAAAGVELALDMTKHSLTGLPTPGQLLKFRRMAKTLLRLARERQPDAVICVDFQLFNSFIAGTLRDYVNKRQDWFHDWRPKIIQYVSPQVWASREGRAAKIARNCDLLLSIVPFEKEWYAQRVPSLRVEFVGHPIVDRYGKLPLVAVPPSVLNLVLLPGSRTGEIARHVPVMLNALSIIQRELPDLRAIMVVPNESLLDLVKEFNVPPDLELRSSSLPDALSSATAAIAKTGTVNLECAYFGVPTVALYKTWWVTFQLGKRLATVRYMSMPNLLANEEVFPEFIQDDATPENLARGTLELLKNREHRENIRQRLKQLIATLGPPGASTRAARAILDLLE